MRDSKVGIIALSVIILLTCSVASGQSLGGAGTVAGMVTDASGAAVPAATVSLVNRITGYQQTASTDAQGSFRFNNVPPNTYHLEVTANGFAMLQKDIAVRSSVPLNLALQLEVEGEHTTVVVEGAGADLLENVPYAHNDIDKSMYSRLPTTSPASGLSDAIVFASPGVVADSNGFFHPLGDHAQVTFSIDGQPISDQQSKQFSTQIPLNAIQSMEVLSGAPPAEYGDKTSLVVNATTRSALGQKPHGSFLAQYGSFGTIGEEGTFGVGNAKMGNFLVLNAIRSGRFLDTPEFRPIHAIGNNGTFFDRFDYLIGGKDAVHLNLFAARNWFQTPNNYDQPNQDQRQKVDTFNVAPGYQHTFSAHTLLTVNPFVRRDHVNYYPSRDAFDDTPATLAQDRILTNYGVRADVSHIHGIHNFKFGVQLTQTRLNETFGLGITDPAFNAVCVDAQGQPEDLPNVTDPAQCATLGLVVNPDLQPGLVPFDLTRAGQLFHFNGKASINEQAAFAQDSITLGNLNIIAGLRLDRYDGLLVRHGIEPRVGISYLVKHTGTVLRAAYSRTFETPYNENLILSSATGAGGLGTNVFGDFTPTPIEPGRRNQYNAGLQQHVGRFLLIDADYFWKFTHNAFDFGTLLDTPVQFPISWRQSKIDGISIRFSTPDLHGFQAYTTIGHNRARYFGPSNGGLIFNSPVEAGVFRIDHDQAFQQTTHLRYQRPNNGPWFAFTWRYDSGLVAGAVPDLESALALTAAQQAAIGFFCGSQRASVGNPITACDESSFGAIRLRIPAPGTGDDDHNPPRITPRHLFDLGVGTDNLLHTERVRTTLKLTVVNLTNHVALYNFLSTFSGTHFVTPRAFTAEVGFVF
jgi:hypothetical protein